MNYRLDFQKREQGAALIMALIIIALVATISTTLMFRLRLDIHRTILVASAQKIEVSTSYTLAWAQLIYTHQIHPFFQKANSGGINDNSSVSEAGSSTSTSPNFPIEMPIYHSAQLSVQAHLVNAQSLFNLNNLRDPFNIYLFAHLIRLVDDHISRNESLDLAKEVAYFIGNKNYSTQEQIYTLFNPAYRPPHHFMTSPSELRLVNHFTPELVEALMPYIIALPEPTKLDPNNADKKLLMVYGLTEDSAKKVIEFIGENGAFKNLSDFYSHVVFDPGSLPSSLDLIKLDPNSQPSNFELFDSNPKYFLLISSIELNPLHWTVYNLLQVDPRTGKLISLQQSRNAL